MKKTLDDFGKMLFSFHMQTKQITSEEIKSIQGISRIYRRDTIATLEPTKSKSAQYSRCVARDIFRRFPQVDIVEYVTTGNKTDSQLVGRRGVSDPGDNAYVYICSTGGKFGKSARNFQPRVKL